jgi:hypothetical protein
MPWNKKLPVMGSFTPKLNLPHWRQPKRERENHQDEIETEHAGYLLGQDTFYVGYLKGVGRIYQLMVLVLFPL